MNDETPETDVRQVMVGSFLDRPTATLPGLIEFGSHVPDDVTDALAIVDRLLADDRLHVTLSTPPADDVREAMLEAVSDVLVDTFSDAVTERIAADILSRLSAKHEVRPRGTITDAEVEAALDVFAGFFFTPSATTMRAALEAARKARS